MLGAASTSRGAALVARRWPGVAQRSSAHLLLLDLIQDALLVVAILPPAMQWPKHFFITCACLSRGDSRYVVHETGTVPAMVVQCV